MSKFGVHGQVRVVTTQHAEHFWKEADLPDGTQVFRDADEWREWEALGDPVLHIELRRWADVLIVAPLDANSLAKMACGMCDNLVTCVVRCWDFAARPMVVAPAMNTLMYEHPATEQHLATLRQWGIHIVPPIAKKLACGDVGVGAMAAPDDIVSATMQILLSSINGDSSEPQLKKSKP